VSGESAPETTAARTEENAPVEEHGAAGEERTAPSAGASAAAESIFVRVAENRFEPTEHARGPWDPHALHGGAPAALITAALEHIEPGAELPFARLYFEFLRPVPLAPLHLDTRITRPGRRVQALEAELRAGDAESGVGELVCRAQALRILPAPDVLPPRSGQLIRECSPPRLPDPAKGHGVRFALDDPQRPSFAGSAMEMRFVHGHPLKGALPDDPAGYEPVGAAAVWMRLRHPLLPGEPTSALARVPATADFGNGVASVLPFDRYLFINADLSIELDRRPQGEWIGLDAHTLLYPEGIGWAESVLHDERGPLGRVRQTLVVQPR
jgi:acyl-coenzyme A thioesterase PaaI-like protein